VHLRAHAQLQVRWPELRGSEVETFETLKHISNRHTTGAQLCAPVRGLPFLPRLELAL